MKESKNIFLAIIAIIMIIIICLLTNKVISASITSATTLENASDPTSLIGETLYVTRMDSSNEFNLQTNLDLYCIEHGQDTIGENYTIGAVVEIKGDTITTAVGKDNTNFILNTVSDKTKKSNLILSEIIYRSKNVDLSLPLAWYDKCLADTSHDHDLFVTHPWTCYMFNNAGKGITIRNRYAADGENIMMTTDLYQWLIWKQMNSWRGTVFDLSKGVAATYIPESNEETASDWATSTSKWAEHYLEEINTEIASKTITDIDIQFNNANTVLQESNETIIQNKEYTILGPFSMTYGGTLSELKVYFDIDKGTTSSNIKIGKYVSSTFTTMSYESITSGMNFYIAIPSAELLGKTNLDIYAKVVGEGKERTTTLYILQSNESEQQILMYATQKEDNKEAEKTASYTLNLKVDVSLEKQNSDATALKAEGIKFTIKDVATNQTVAYFITDANGNGVIANSSWKATGEKTVKLLTNKKYLLTETTNNVYGYKKRSLSEDYVSVPEGAIIEQNENNSVYFTLQKGKDKYNVVIKNQKELGNVQIEKIGNDGTKLEDVEFIIKTATNKYLQLQDSDGEIVPSRKGTTTINSNNIASSTEYHVEYISSNANATRFITDENGKIVIKNLEVNLSNTLTDYQACEVSNTNYGYGSYNNSNEGTIFNLTNGETKIVTIENSVQLGNIEIVKNNADNSTKVLSNVEFVIGINTSEGQYLALYDINGNRIPSIIGTATINNKNIANSEEYRVSYVDEANATIFITDENGKVVLNNLEIYKSKDSKYTYTVYEVNNPNHGYNDDNVSESIQLDANKETVALEIENVGGLGNLEIIKKDANDSTKVLQNVEFILEINKINKEYIALYDANGNKISSIIGIATINRNNVAKTIEEVVEYRVEYVTNASEATIFITDENGKIIINNLEIYASKDNKYTYTVYEVNNPNYGYNDDIENKSIQLGNDTETVTLDLENVGGLGNLEIVKKDANDATKVLQNVEFIIGINKNDKEYITLYDINENKIPAVKGTVTINENNVARITEESVEYRVEYVTNESDATIFLTDPNGKIVINNVEVYKSKTEKYTYTAYEVNNHNYSYNDGNSNVIFELTVGETKTVTVENVGGVAHIGLIKCDEENQEKVLEGVEFKITGIRGYIALYDEGGNKKTSIKGTVTINKENVATSTEYRVGYVTNESDATTFITNEEGKIVINNVEVYKSATETITYIAKEIYNPNYGYGSGDNYKEIEITNLTVNEITEVTISNQNNLTGITLKRDDDGDASGKHDEDYPNIKLEDVEFVLGTHIEKTKSYIMLYDQEGKFVSRVKGNIIINSENTAQVDGTGIEYRLEYYQTTKDYKEFTDDEKANITIFLTGSQGELSVENLETYKKETGEKYTYTLIEVFNPHYGYNSEFEKDINVESGQMTEVEVPNTQEYIKLSGYVWIENTGGKSNEYDSVYTNTSSDIKLTDLYLIDENGEVAGINTVADIPVQVKLYKKDGTLIKDKPDEFNTETGEYTFNEIEVSELSNYEVVFIYDGFYYTTIVENLQIDNGSKAKENSAKRDELNNKFAIIQDESEVVTNDGTVNTMTYTKEGKVSTVERFNFDTTISASTNDTKYDLANKLHEIKSAATTPVSGITNINMGLVLREQPKISLNSNIYNVIVGFEGAKYNYKFGESGAFKDIGVNLEQKGTSLRYSSTIYGSDIQGAMEQGKDLNVYITYEVQAINDSNTLSVLPRQIINYYDSRYELVGVGLGLDSTYQITESLTYAIQEGRAQGKDEYKAVIINFNQKLELKEYNYKSFYITFKLSTGSENEANRNAIYGLLNGSSTFHNASEILSYTSYYGENTSMMEGTQYISDTTTAGSVYAGIDKESQPGNLELKLTDYIDKDGNKDGTQVLDTSLYEPDSTSAPSLLLDAGEKVEGVRRISGNIWEDLDDNKEDIERLGNGYIDAEEKFIANVTVTLFEANPDGTIGNVAKYSDGVTNIITTTDENGSYTLGYYDEATKKYNGILPGKEYIIQYTYGNESYIVGENRYLNVNDYKSTIITSDVIETAIKETSENVTYNGVEYPIKRWHLIKEDNRYSDAIDDFDTRTSLDEEVVNYSTYEDTILAETTMDAYSPVMYIPIEYTPTDSVEMLDISEDSIVKEKQFISNLENVDFGIIERPRVNITIDKEITSLGISTQIGADIIPEGNPSDPNSEMQYVKTGLDGLVQAEIETNLLQGAGLHLEYTITLKNDCELDYTAEDYYYYGIIPEGATERTLKISKVVDYLDGTMSIETEKSGIGEVWKETSISDLTTAGLISPETIEGLNNGNYTILSTEAFNEIQSGEEKSIKLYTTKVLASSAEIQERNHVEIIELIGGRTIKNSIPGDYNPATATPNQQDDDNVRLIVTTPTGTTMNYMPYMIAVPVTLVIVILGIAIIKKKVLI